MSTKFRLLRPRRLRRLGLLAMLLLPAQHSQAARPVTTDDASILSPGDCQLESWVEQSSGLRQQVLHPACNSGGRLEWGVNLTATQGRDSSAAGLAGLQLKWVPREVDVAGWTYGLSYGATRPVRLRALAGPALGATQVATALWTAAPSPRWLLHANVGASYTPGRLGSNGRPQGVTALWAAAAECSLDGRWGVHLEAFGEHHGRPTHQVGARYWLVSDQLQLDASLGRQPHADGSRGGEPVASLGLAWVWPGP